MVEAKRPDSAQRRIVSGLTPSNSAACAVRYVAMVKD